MNSLNSQHSTHLSEEAVNDLLIGLGSLETRQHLAGCEQCRARLESFHAEIDLFNQTSLAWSEARRKPIPKQAFRSQSRFFAPRPFLWSSATTALLLAAVASWNYTHRPLPIFTPPAIQGVDDSPTQIAEDNQLLRNVYTALNDEPQPPFSETSFASGAGSSSAAHKARTQ